MYIWTGILAATLYVCIVVSECQKLAERNTSAIPTVEVSFPTVSAKVHLTIPRVENSSEEFTSVRGISTTRLISSKYAENNSENAADPDKFAWWLCFSGPQPEARYKEECCSYEFRKFKARWFSGGCYLTTLLDNMKRWNCTEFEEECRNPTYAFDEFTHLVYDQFCNKKTLTKKCTDKLHKVAESYGFIKDSKENFTENRWDVLIESLNSSQMRLDDLSQPCIGIALYDRKDGGPGRFHEIVEPYIPFCSLKWSGYDLETAMERKVSPWTSMSNWCRASFVICMIILIIATALTIVANSTILGVFYKTPKLRNSQAVYKISLAMADLLVGLIVWTNMTVMQDWISMYPRPMGSVIRPWISNSTTWKKYYFPMDDPSLEYRKPGGKIDDVIPIEYVKVVGFFITFSLIISVYTLMFASFDRFLAVYRPLRYHKHDAKRQAKIICAGLWIFAFILACLPIFISDIKYKVISAIFVTSDGTTALALLFIGFVIPLIIVWMITIATFQSSKMHARHRQRIVQVNANASNNLDIRLAKTLAMMVGIFSISVVPAMLCTIAGFFLPYTSWAKPEKLNIHSAMVYTSCEYVAIILLTSNSFWNCIIYSIRTQGFRQATKDIYRNLMKKSGMKHIGRGARSVISSARRVSLSSLYSMRNMSSSIYGNVRRKSTFTLVTRLSDTQPSMDSSSARPSIDYSSAVFMDSSIYSGLRTKGQNTNGEDEEWVGEDPTSRSLTVDARPNRLFASVMENVEELDEEDESERK